MSSADTATSSISRSSSNSSSESGATVPSTSPGASGGSAGASRFRSRARSTLRNATSDARHASQSDGFDRLAGAPPKTSTRGSAAGPTSPLAGSMRWGPVVTLCVTFWCCWWA